MTLRPKSVFIVITPSGMIVGCFYSRQAASNFAGYRMQLKELKVETHGINIGWFERFINYIFNL